MAEYFLTLSQMIFDIHLALPEFAKETFSVRARYCLVEVGATTYFLHNLTWPFSESWCTYQILVQSFFLIVFFIATGSPLI